MNGAAVAIDAAGCQKAIVGQSRGQGGEYVAGVKGKRGTLHRAVGAAAGAAAAAEFAGCDTSETVERGHGRHEERYGTVIRDPRGLTGGRAGVGAVVVVGREREAGGRHASTCPSYLARLRGTAAELGGYIRGQGVWRAGCTGASMSRSGRTRTGRGTRAPGLTWAWPAASPPRS